MSNCTVTYKVFTTLLSLLIEILPISQFHTEKFTVWKTVILSAVTCQDWSPLQMSIAVPNCGCSCVACEVCCFLIVRCVLHLLTISSWSLKSSFLLNNEWSLIPECLKCAWRRRLNCSWATLYLVSCYPRHWPYSYDWFFSYHPTCDLIGSVIGLDL